MGEEIKPRMTLMARIRRMFSIREIRVIRGDILSDAEIANVFRVGADTEWFRAVLQVVGEVERELVRQARMFADQGRAMECVNGTGGGAACEMIAERLVRLREQSVKGKE